MSIIYHSSYLVDYNVVMRKSDSFLNFAVFYLKNYLLKINDYGNKDIVSQINTTRGVVARLWYKYGKENLILKYV